LLQEIDAKNLAPPPEMQKVEKLRAVGKKRGIPEENIIILASKDGRLFLSNFGHSFNDWMASGMEISFQEVKKGYQSKDEAFEDAMSVWIAYVKDSAQTDPIITWFLFYFSYSLMIDFVKRNPSI